MTGQIYRPGNWIGLVSGGTAVLLEPGAADDLVQQLWQALESGATLESLLGTVVSGCGANLSAMPQFGIVSTAGGIHAVLRGDVVVSADADGQALSGRGVSSWTEGRLASGSVTIAAGSGRSAGTDTVDQPAPWLPLRAGAVQLGILRLGAVPAAVPARRAEAAASELAFVGSGLSGNLDMTGIYVPEDDPDDAAAATGPAAAIDQPAGGQVAPGTEAAVDDLDQTIVHAAAQGANLPAAPQQQSAVQGSTAVALDAPAGPTGGKPAQPTDLIDAVPWLTRSASAGVAASAAAPDQQPAASAHLGPEPAARPARFDEGDHDGQTLMRSELPDVSDAAAPAGTAPSSSPPSTAPMVLARTCRDGHANPPTSSACSVCGALLDEDAQEVQRPVLGRMRVSTGDVVELDRPVIVGRQPSANRVQGSVMPRLVPVHSASGDISRSHVEVRLEGWHVILADLKSTNGTVLLRGRQAPRRLGHGEAVMLLDGDIADLGDGISLRFEDLP
ncbi:FHA domain-containing protein [Arthrobacter sp.]|uniref:FHA domain-containing protein n=1 Tax=Arthrobacter sp. TaxID=1667 RepID=UPI00339B7A3F